MKLLPDKEVTRINEAAAVDLNNSNNRYRVVTTTGDGASIESSPHTIAEGAPFLSITTALEIPEPASFVLFALGLIGACIMRRSR